ncbi:uncharacterized protein [Temnothorax nylanderi]|uniref:uncharacterized protein n=1 Tax=Temnothorax nylanderi TaxID=102681 RepID=UPI003A869CD6
MAYAVVEFDDKNGSGVAAVNSAWLTPLKREVFWPPYKEQKKFDKALKTGEPVDTEKWTLHSITRIFYRSDDLLKTREKLKLSQVISNLESEEENEGVRKKRKRISTRIPTSSDNELEEQRETRLPRPPPIKRTNLNFNACKNLEQDFTLTRSHSPLPISTLNRCGNISPSVASASTASPVINNISTIPHRQITQTTDNFEKLVSLVATVKEQNTEILRWINRQNTTNNALPDIPFAFPLNTVEEVDQLDVYLKTNNNDSIALSAYLSTLGGNHVPSKTNRILRYILADAVAVHFNFYGKRSQKKAFSDLSLKNLVVSAVKTRIINATDKEVEDAIKVWLKHAQDRMKKARENARQN